MAPKVLVSDKLSETAVQIFIDRGIEVDSNVFASLVDPVPQFGCHLTQPLREAVA